LDFAPILHTFHGVLSFGYGVNLSSDTLFELGWDTGLRGYESASFTGHKLFRITAEDRIFPSRNIFGLVALGGVLFWDAGYVWDEDEKVDPGDVRHDVGVGLRIGIPTFSGENILRLDFGFPIGHAASLSEYLFTMVTSTTF
jgi:outer membrane protein assembly factor BamA